MKIEDHTKYHPLMQKNVNKRPEIRNLECWLIHLGGDAYLSIDEDNNYLVTKDMNAAFRIAISPSNYKLAEQIIKRLKNRSGFGSNHRIVRVVWKRGTRLTPLNEVVE